MSSSIFKELEKGSLQGLKRCISLFPTSVTTKNAAGATALHVAAAQGLSAFVKDLLVHGAPHDVTDSQGNLPLHLAAAQGSLESVTELLTGPGRKLVVKAKNREGQTPLHLAVRNGHTAVVAKLLDAGARTDAKDKAGITPLELVSAEDEEMLQLLLDSTPTSTMGSVSQGIGTSLHSSRALEASQVSHRLSTNLMPSVSVPTSMASSRFITPQPIKASSSRLVAGTPSTPPSRSPAQGLATGGRVTQATPSTATTGGMTNRGPPSGSVTLSGATSRLPRNIGAAANASPGSSVGPSLAAGPGAASVTAGTSSINAQFQKQDSAIQALAAGLRTATERLGTVDACATAQLECASQVEKALETCGSHSRALADLEARVGFQEDRGRDTRSRLDRLEEGERTLQMSFSRLVGDQRGMSAQLHQLTEQVATAMSGAAQQQHVAPASQVQTQLQADLAVLRAQVDQLAPALAVATAAGAEVRTLAARLDVVQQQQHQQAALQAQQQQPPVGGNVLLDQQVLQLQAQVQLLQLPVASLTQQCADLSTRLGGLTDWQQHARAELSRLAEAAGQANQTGGKVGGELSDAVMRVLDTTARTMSELRQQQDETAKLVAALQQQQQAQNVIPTTPVQASRPGLPSTPQSTGQRPGSVGDPGPLGGPPSRNISLGGMGRDAAAQAELRTDLEALKSLMADVRKEVASEGGSLRREWQRAFSDMQTRYGEQANELRAREQNIAKLREAMLVEEAERRAVSGFEEKVTKRLSKLETGIEYLTHRLEVLEEQVTGLANTVAGPSSPSVALSPGALPPAAGRLPLSNPQSRSTPRTGPGPVSENHSNSAVPAPHLAAAAVATLASSLAAAAAACAAAPARSTSNQEQEEWWRAADTQQQQPLTGREHLSAASALASGRPPPPATGPVFRSAKAGCGPAVCHPACLPSAPGGASGVQAVGIDRIAAAASSPIALGAAAEQQERRRHLAGSVSPAGCAAGTWSLSGAPHGLSPRTYGPGAAELQGSLLGAGTNANALVTGDLLSPPAPIDPANVALGPQLLQAAAQALLAPSVDIQRLAAAAAAQCQGHDQQQPQHAHQQQDVQVAAHMHMPNQSRSAQQMSRGPADGGGVRRLPGPDGGNGSQTAAVATGAGTSLSSPRSSSARKEPPMCFFCPVQ